MIMGNVTLSSLTELENIDTSSITGIYIYDNLSLSTCEATWLCAYLASPNGSVNIYSNAPGCNNPSEVADGCGIVLPCLPFGNYYFLSQDDINNFQTNYPGCTEIEGYVTIQGDDITNLDGLNVLTSIGGILEIGKDYGGNGNPVLTDLTGLENLTSIGRFLSIEDNDALTNLTGLENLVSIGEGFKIYSNNFLTSLTGLESLTSIGGDLNIYNNADLASLTGVESLTSIGGDLNIYNNADLASLTGLENLTTIGEYPSKNGKASLASLTLFDNVASIGGNCSIYDNYALSNLTGLEGLTSIGGNFSICDNYALTNLTGLENLASIEGDLDIYYNNALTSLTGLEGLNSIGGDLDIYYNAALTSLTGVEGLASIGGSLTISSECLTCLTGLDNLTSIGEDLRILGPIMNGSSSLTSLTGLENLASIGGTLEISNHYFLTNLTGLENIAAESIINLRIFNNSDLSSCAVQSICDYLAAPNGTIEIAYNAPGCNSQQEVQEACWILHIENRPTGEEQLNVYPNPAYNRMILNLNTTFSGSFRVCLYNLTGICLKSWQFETQSSGTKEFVMDISEIPAGIYFFRLQIGNEVVTRKIIKVK
ncbi:protein containing Por secretion system C-terminal sorting domain [Lentimicrobium saccharophilum]|uniref:Protein containing Por secretion system C-terminal sorting domain n=2 Tax=Lentimicrobium saccharophilum TaxID=1678841 RepID=A0A0S7BTT2_9BACT|nr:protein containing Por secretion system C-terminal sorting domain [Lentimicrobium saccharophilum]